MKKNYEKPEAEKLTFDYAKAVTASEGFANGKNPGHHCGDPRDVSHWDNPGNNPNKFP